MSETNIEWTDRVWNCVRGCSRVSSGCDNCYAIREARRHDHAGGSYEGLTRLRSDGAIDWSGVVRVIQEKLEEPLRWRKPSRIFVNSMSDLFHESLRNEDIDEVFSTMELVPQHTFQILTKRPKRMESYIRHRSQIPRVLRNVWLGVSVEDQKTADERIPLLLQTPAAIRFVSYEPALGPVDFRPFLIRNPSLVVCPKCLYFTNRAESTCPNDGSPVGPDIAIDWIIVGGESGPGARSCDVAWIRDTVHQCREAGVPVFVKQAGSVPTIRDVSPEEYLRNYPEDEWPIGTHFGNPTKDPALNGRVALLKSRKGGDLSEIPDDLRIREFPR